MVYSESNTPRRTNKVRYEVVERIGVLNKKKSGWTREVNVVAWNGNAPKVDIREWDPQHVRMSRGVTLLEEEAERLAQYLARRYGLIYPENTSDQGYVNAGQHTQNYSSGSSLYSETEDIPFESSPATGGLYEELKTVNQPAQEPASGGGLYEEREPGNVPFEEQTYGGGLYDDQAYGDEVAGDGAGGSAAVAAEGGAGQDDEYAAEPAPPSAADEEQ
jgi:hypothetical protein